MKPLQIVCCYVSFAELTEELEGKISNIRQMVKQNQPISVYVHNEVASNDVREGYKSDHQVVINCFVKVQLSLYRSYIQLHGLQTISIVIHRKSYHCAFYMVTITFSI